MSSKFGLMDGDDEVVEPLEKKIDLSGFAPVKKRSPLNLAEVDAAAAPHGFVSREPLPLVPTVASMAAPVRRRRATPAEPSRQLAVRMIEAEYDRFLNYADRHKLTYSEAIAKLLDAVGE